MSKSKVLGLISLLGLILLVISFQIYNVEADALSDNITNQLNNLDLSALEDFVNNLKDKPENFVVRKYIEQLLAGNYTTYYSLFFNFIFDLITNSLTEILPSLLCIFSIVFSLK